MANRWKEGCCSEWHLFKILPPFLLEIILQLIKNFCKDPEAFRASLERLMSRKLMQINFVYVCTFTCFLTHLGRALLLFFLLGHHKWLWWPPLKLPLLSLPMFYQCKLKLLSNTLNTGLSWLSIWLVAFLKVLFGCLLNPPITVVLI